MLDINFIRGRKRSGMEFIDFQNEDFRDKLVPAIDKCIKMVDGVATISGEVGAVIAPIIEEFCGFKNITFKMMAEANFSIDVGYFSPSNVLNITNIERYIDLSDSNISQWYGKERSKVFKGHIDMTAGKVYGAYAEIPAIIYIGKLVGKIVPQKDLDKLKSSYAEATAACIAHELGHIFFACVMIDVNATDNFIMRGAMKAFGATNQKEKRLTIIRSTASLLQADIDKKDNVEAIVENGSESEALVYFSALINRRNHRRALSVGVETMTSEVGADLYAIRMGFDRGLVAVLRSVSSTRVTQTMSLIAIISLFTAALIFIFVPGLGLFQLVAFMAATIPSSIIIYAATINSAEYNSPFRRYEDAVRQTIAKVKERKDMPAKDKERYIEMATVLLSDCEKHKPYIAGTFIERFLGTIALGGDYKANEFEHFTQTIANNEVMLLNEKMQAL